MGSRLNAPHPLQVSQGPETLKVKQTPWSVLSVCTVSHREKRSERDSRIVELRITIGVGNSSAAEAVSRSARGGCSKRPTEGTMRLIFRTVFRSAV